MAPNRRRPAAKPAARPALPPDALVAARGANRIRLIAKRPPRRRKPLSEKAPPEG